MLYNKLRFDKGLSKLCTLFNTSLGTQLCTLFTSLGTHEANSVIILVSSYAFVLIIS